MNLKPNKSIRKHLLMAFLFCQLQFTSTAQPLQHVEPAMLEIETQAIKYKMDGNKETVTVNNFYVSKYPESNKQYKQYLKSLNEEERAAALPNYNILKQRGLKDKQIKFILEEYFISEQYSSYPIIGLNTIQIVEYLHWKTEYVGKKVLKENNIHFNPDEDYIDILNHSETESSIPTQIEFNLMLESHLISAYKQLRKENKKKRCTKDNTILRDLNISSIDCYDLRSISKLDELIVRYSYGEKITREGKSYTVHELEEGQLFRLYGKVKKDLSCDDKAEGLLRPFRVWHIKL